MSEDIEKPSQEPRKYRLTHLGNLNQVTKGLAKTLRAMSNGTLDTADGARICNGLGILRTCLEAKKLEQLEARMAEISRLLSARQVTPFDRKLSIDHETNGHPY